MDLVDIGAQKFYELRFLVDPDEAKRLREIAKRKGLTPAQVAHGFVKEGLARASSESRIIVPGAAMRN